MVLMYKLNVYKPVDERAVAEHEARGFKRVESAPPVDTKPPRGGKLKQEPDEDE